MALQINPDSVCWVCKECVCYDECLADLDVKDCKYPGECETCPYWVYDCFVPVPQ